MLDIEQLYQAHSVALMRYLVRACGDAELAADIVQETFLRCAQRPPRPDYAREWLFRVATNLVRETGRTNRRRLRLVESAPHRLPLPNEPATPDAEYGRAQTRAMVRDALMALAPRDRMALLMREEGFSHREIASTLGVANNSAGKLIMRALERFARHLPRELEKDHS